MPDFSYVEGEVKNPTFEYQNSDGSAKDVSGSTFTMSVDDYDGSTLFSKSNVDFDTSNAASGKVTVNVDVDQDIGKTGTFSGRVTRDGGSNDVDVKKFTMKIESQ